MFYILLIIVLLLHYWVNRFKLTGLSFFVWSYLIGFHIGAIYIDDSASSAFNLFIILSSLFLIAVLLGAALIEKFGNFNVVSIYLYHSLFEFPDELTFLQKRRLIIVVIMSFVVGSYYFRYGIPFFSSDPNLARFKAVSGATPFLFMLTFLAPMFLAVLLSNMTRVSKSIGYMVSVFTAFLTGFRSAPAKLLLAIYIASRGTLSLRLIRDSFLFLLLLVVIFAVTYSKFWWLDFETVLNRVIDRVFLVNIHNSLYVIELYNHIHLMGDGLLMDMSNYFPSGKSTFGEHINQYIYGYESGVSINPSFTILWADFGWGYLVVSFCLGVVIQLFDKIHSIIKLNSKENIIWVFFILTLGLAMSGNPYAKNLYYTLPMIFYIVVARKFILLR